MRLLARDELDMLLGCKEPPATFAADEGLRSVQVLEMGKSIEVEMPRLVAEGKVGKVI